MLFGKTCRHCGQRNRTAARFCDACGDSLRSPSRSGGCAGRLFNTLLLLVIGVVAVVYLARTDRGLLTRRPTQEGDAAGVVSGPATPSATAALADTQVPAATQAPTVTPDGITALAHNAGQRAVVYRVEALAAGASAGPTISIDYVETGGRAAHVEATAPWEQSTQLGAGCMARIVAQGPAGQPFVARIYLGASPACEAQASPVLGNPALWRAQCEAACGP
ncbi:MAG: hypothetical protein GXY68_10090 [Chloroflexi bacterium]|nr:hypothetical protein [Chloroflexota bacterium]